MLTFFGTISLMDEARVQQQARDEDEQSTQRRAAILGLPYLDTRTLENDIALIDDVIDIQTMHKSRIVPLVAGGDSQPWQFGITTQTPQSLLGELTQKYADQAQNVRYFLISQVGSARSWNDTTLYNGSLTTILKLPMKAIAKQSAR